MNTFTLQDVLEFHAIGSGGEGDVFKAKIKKFGWVALKVFKSNQKVNVREIENMRKFSHHPNIIQFFGTITVDNTLSSQYGYVMKYMPQGSVYDAMHVKKLNYSLKMAYSWILQAARAIAYLHDNNVIHRDIKPANMLLSENLEHLSVSDFGLAKIDNRSTTSFQGSTDLYRSPEMFQNLTDHCISTDVFSFAISMWEIITKRAPYHEIATDWQLRVSVITGIRPSLKDISDVDVAQLLAKLWIAEASVRPKMEEVVKFFEERAIQATPTAEHIGPEGTNAMKEESTVAITELPAETQMETDSSSWCENLFVPEDLEYVDYIFTGWCGSIFSAKTKNFGMVAVKIHDDPTDLEEIAMLRKLSYHPNIVQFFGIINFMETNRTGFVMKFMENQSVFHAIHEKMDYTTEIANSWLLQAARAMAYLHDNEIIHGNIKPLSMLLSDSYKTLKVCSFGMTKKYESDGNESVYETTSIHSTTIRRLETDDYWVDVHSFALSIWEIMQKRLWDRDLIEEAFLSGKKYFGPKPPLGEMLDDTLANIVEKAWSEDCSLRPTMKHILDYFEK